MCVHLFHPSYFKVVNLVGIETHFVDIIIDVENILSTDVY